MRSIGGIFLLDDEGNRESFFSVSVVALQEVPQEFKIIIFLEKYKY